MRDFGERLRQHRERCTDPATQQPLKQARFADLLNDEWNIHAYTGATISNWELGKHSIDHENRDLLIALIRVLHTCGGLSTMDEADTLLKAGRYDALNDAEAQRISPSWRAGKPNAPFISASVGIQTFKTVLPQPDAAREPPFTAPSLQPQGIVGREADLAHILAQLHHDDVSILALQGMGGVGKTTLAQAVGSDPRIVDMFPDGVLWVALGPKPDVRTALVQWGRMLGLDLLALPNEAACQERLRARAFDRRMLLIVDDVWDEGHGRAFLVGGANCRALVTTRETPIAHALALRAHTIRVNTLTPEASLALLHRLASAMVEATPNAARRLCERLEYLPLALTLAGRLLANEADVPHRLESIIHELIERREARLQLLQSEGRRGLSEDEPVSLQAILALSVERLDQADQLRFASLAPFGGEPHTWNIEAVQAVWQCTLEEAEATVARLIQRGLVEYRNPRYWIHALLADYAEELAERWGLS